MDPPVVSFLFADAFTVIFSMKQLPSFRMLCGVTLASVAVSPAFAQSFYGDPPDANHPWAIHDPHRPLPPVVTGATPSTQEKPGNPPSDAVVLFDGTEAALANWCSDKNPSEPTKWVVKDGALQCMPGSGYIRTKDAFGDCQLHIEWAAPEKVEGDGQGRGNSGVFLMGEVEVQVLDNYNNPTYADGYAGAVYGVNPPMVNALRPPGEWQTYDIIFRRPVWKDGKEVDPGYLTVFVNGVLVQDHTPLEGGGGHQARSKPRPFPEKGPLKLQDHGNPVRFRNIWYRPLPPRAIEGGTDGFLTEEAATAKKKEIAAGLRERAAKQQGNARLLGLMESLAYEKDETAMKDSEQMLASWLDSLKQVPEDQMESKKGEVKRFYSAVSWLARFNIMPSAAGVKEELRKIIKARDWDK